MTVSPLHLLRQSIWLARLVLAGVWLSLGVALASPIAHPQRVDLVCSGAGVVKLIVQGDDGTRDLGNTPMDCPMCQSFAAPPPVVPGWEPLQGVGVGVFMRLPVWHVPRVAGAPLPSRGPPVWF